ncbi:rhomboid family intramembrane serine protease [Gracilimonas mengyeensis]|uniref:Membrane associated serine protease, rhomboid family n=1 Tax=Gracilimonas mengyeensis TaxID=1302730 RepID=A0A521DVD5_9BACT|nr:rhomboid family intramembrane serine protease [Gracilimonas mengyeensis]SMO75683.1 Membrane associated serine protease, rhomboid family [Gracilimonas mengyeensis]
MDNYSPNTQFSVFPPVIKNLLIINGLVFLATVSIFGGGFTGFGEMVFPYLALFPIGSGNFFPWQLVTYMFLHAGIGHIFFNLFALWIFGQAIEQLWGSKRFLIYYLLTGIGAALIHMWIGGGGAPTIGASGAVFGILLAFGMMFPDKYIMLLIPPIPIKAKYFVAIYGAFELFAGISNPFGGIAHFAHLGGIIVGFILIKYWGLKKPTNYI